MILDQGLIALKRIQEREESKKPTLKQHIAECLMIALGLALFVAIMMIGGN